MLKMKEDTDDGLESASEITELALPGDIIRKRHIATRANIRRRIVVVVDSGDDFEGYSIGLDDHTLQLLELPSGEVSSIALKYIVSISDGKPFDKLDPDEKDIVDRRTSSFRKTSYAWLVTNWPTVYDRRIDGGRRIFKDPKEEHQPPRITSRLVRADSQARREFAQKEERVDHDGDSQVRE